MIEARSLKTPDGVARIVSLPAGHWYSLDYMLQHSEWQTLDRVIATAFKAYQLDQANGYDTPFSTAIGFTIQEAYIQFSAYELGYVNDNDAA